MGWYDWTWWWLTQANVKHNIPSYYTSAPYALPWTALLYTFAYSLLLPLTFAMYLLYAPAFSAPTLHHLHTRYHYPQRLFRHTTHLCPLLFTPSHPHTLLVDTFMVH